jgi:undecaprenyl-diphosphatase
MDNFLFASIYSAAFTGVWTDALIILFAAYWEIVVAAVLLIYLWSPKLNRVDLKVRAKKTGWALFSAIVARFGVVELIRFLYPRERPFVANGLDALINQNPLESSFPSGHATFFMALAVYLILAGDKKLGWFILVSAVAIGLARVAAGIHWPSDVMVGWAVGAIVGFIVFKITNIKNKIL